MILLLLLHSQRRLKCPKWVAGGDSESGRSQVPLQDDYYYYCTDVDYYVNDPGQSDPTGVKPISDCLNAESLWLLFTYIYLYMPKQMKICT
jgi:hypothetical protein